MRRTVMLVTAVLGLAVAGCQPTGSPRCDQFLAPIVVADSYGYTIDCTPPASWPLHLGWTDHEHRTIYVWADRMNDRALLKIMWHEDGHAYFEVTGRTFSSQQAEECAADRYAWDHMLPADRLGVSFLAC